MYTQVIVPLDGSELAEQVLPYARELAQKLNIPVKLLRFYEAPAPELSDPSHGRYLDQMDAALRDQANDYLHKVSVSRSWTDTQVEYTALATDPATGIIEEADQDHNALIAMTTHGRTGLGRWVLGSVTDKVLHAVSNPLLVVRSLEGEQPHKNLPLKKMIVPLDGSPLAEEILPHVVLLAKALTLDIRLVRARPAMQEYQHYMESHPMGGSATVYTGPFEVFSREVDAQAMGYLHDVRLRLQRKGVWSVDQGLIREHAAEAIIEAAGHSPDTMIAMSTHGRSGITRWVMGSITDKVVRHSGVPVLVIRATGLESDND